MKDPLFVLVKTFLRKENYSLNFEELKLQLLSHPSYPSLHSVTAVLTHFGIDSLALEVPRNIGTLKQLPERFISLISDKNRSEYVLATRNRDTISLLYDQRKKRDVLFDEFLGNWSGIVVGIEKGYTETPKNRAIRKALPNVLFAMVLLVIVGWFFFSEPNLFQSTHFISTLIGAFISFLILKHEFGFRSSTVDKFCSPNEIMDCDAVLNSEGATVSKYLKLSDISIVYFIGLVFSWIFSIAFKADSSAIMITTLIATPITFYSLYYQHVIIKKWCPLCLGIVGVLWLQCVSLFIDSNSLASIEFDFRGSFILFFGFLITTSIWLFAKALLIKQQRLRKLELSHYKFKRNFDVFNVLYNGGKTVDATIEDQGEIVLGNKKAPLNILLITNPFCIHCRSAHGDLMKILNKNTGDVRISIRFNVPSDSKYIANRVAARLLEIYNTESPRTFKSALHSVYKSSADLDQWSLKWGESANGYFNSLLKKQQKWCHRNDINFTPAVFINGKEFPKEYEVNDLTYFIEDLLESAREESTEVKEHVNVN